MVSEKQYTKPATIEEAIKIVSENPTTCKFIAGGTDVMVNKYQGNDTTSHYIDITSIEELKGIRRDEKFLYIGALTRLSELKKSKDIR